MTRIDYILKELLRNLYRNPGTAIASILSLALLFLLFDLFWIAAGTSEKFYSTLLSDLQMHVYVEESVSDKDIASLTKGITEISGVQGVQYINRDMARKELAGLVGMDLLVGYDEVNPLPRSFIITFAPTHLQSAAIETIETSLKSLLVSK